MLFQSKTFEFRNFQDNYILLSKVRCCIQHNPCFTQFLPEKVFRENTRKVPLILGSRVMKRDDPLVKLPALTSQTAAESRRRISDCQDEDFRWNLHPFNKVFIFLCGFKYRDKTVVLKIHPVSSAQNVTPKLWQRIFPAELRALPTGSCKSDLECKTMSPERLQRERRTQC